MNKFKIKNIINIGDGIGYIAQTKSDNARVLIANKVLQDKYSNKKIRKIGVSVSSGCGIGCVYCFTNNYTTNRLLSWQEIVEEVDIALSHENNIQKFDEIKISFKQMGDPMLNQDAVMKAIRFLANKHPNFHFVVSTSGPKIKSDFFQVLGAIAKNTSIRLQFSCHTTSDQERALLSPKLPMMTFQEIADIVTDWQGGLVTLNFVMIKGYTYNAAKLKELFKPSKVFIKINYLDHNGQTKKNHFQDMEDDQVKMFIKDLQQTGFQYAYRH